MWPGAGIMSDATCPSAYQFWNIRLLQIASAFMLRAIDINCVMPHGFQSSYHYGLASAALDFDDSVLVFDASNDMSAVWTMPFEWSPFLSICHADESPLKKVITVPLLVCSIPRTKLLERKHRDGLRFEAMDDQYFHHLLAMFALHPALRFLQN